MSQPRRYRHRLLATLSVVLVVAGATTTAVALAGGSSRSHGEPSTRSGAASTTPPLGHVPSPTSTTPPLGHGPSPTTSAPLVADPFNAMLSDYLAGRAGKAEAAVWNLTSGQVFDLGGSSPEDDASIVKVNILEALLHEVGPVGLSTSQQALATAMIQQSDNDSATDLWYDSGGTAGIAQFDSGLGLIHTTVSQCVSCPGFPWPGWGLTSSTPSDQLLLLHALVTPNLLLSTTAQAYVLGLMEQVEPSEDWGVSVGVPSSATVALKNGWLPLEGSDSDWQINSEGYVNGDGRDYLISVMTSGSPTEQYGIDTIDEISTMVFAQMG